MNCPGVLIYDAKFKGVPGCFHESGWSFAKKCSNAVYYFFFWRESWPRTSSRALGFVVVLQLFICLSYLLAAKRRNIAKKISWIAKKIYERTLLMTLTYYSISTLDGRKKNYFGFTTYSFFRTIFAHPSILFSQQYLFISATFESSQKSFYNFFLTPRRSRGA